MEHVETGEHLVFVLVLPVLPGQGLLVEEEEVPQEEDGEVKELQGQHRAEPGQQEGIEELEEENEAERGLGPGKAAAERSAAQRGQLTTQVFLEVKQRTPESLI